MSDPQPTDSQTVPVKATEPHISRKRWALFFALLIAALSLAAYGYFYAKAEVERLYPDDAWTLGNVRLDVGGMEDFIVTANQTNVTHYRTVQDALRSIYGDNWKERTGWVDAGDKSLNELIAKLNRTSSPGSPIPTPNIG